MICDKQSCVTQGLNWIGLDGMGWDGIGLDWDYYVDLGRQERVGIGSKWGERGAAALLVSKLRGAQLPDSGCN
jgi:hypothetical protein